jgi:hypothetical protein
LTTRWDFFRRRDASALRDNAQLDEMSTKC